MASDTLKLRFAGALVVELGAQQYPSVTATIAELISNAWDADAKNVWVAIPFGESWSHEGQEIVVLDDGHGMDDEEAQERYLIVGGKRREHFGRSSDSGERLVHGRKGIGKLAAFGTARVLECVSRKADARRPTAFRLNYDEIRRLAPTEEYSVRPVVDPEQLRAPDGAVLGHGTRIRLSGLQVKRATSQSRFMRSMTRRFALRQVDMQVWINGVPLQRFDAEVEFRFPRDGVPENLESSSEGWAIDHVGGKQVQWWIGFTEEPIEDDELRGVSILSNGKLVQRPFMFNRTKGVTGQLGQEYLTGEIAADWIDAGTSVEDDLIQSNRDQLQHEDERLAPLMDWGRKRLDWAIRRRQRLRAQKREREVGEDPELRSLFEEFTPTEQKVFKNIARLAGEFAEASKDSVHELMVQIVTGHKDRAVRELMERIEGEQSETQARIWNLVREFGLIDARRSLTQIEARLAAISQLEKALRDGATEVHRKPDDINLHDIVQENPWLLEPRWHLMSSEVRIKELEEAYRPDTDKESGLRIDFLFVLAPGEGAPLNEVIVVEIKRASLPGGRLHSVSAEEVNRFEQYVEIARDAYAASTSAPVVRGLMVAESYQRPAERARRNLLMPSYEFKQWRQVLEDTKRAHIAWFDVASRRLDAGTKLLSSSQE